MFSILIQFIMQWQNPFFLLFIPFMFIAYVILGLDEEDHYAYHMDKYVAYTLCLILKIAEQWLVSHSVPSGLESTCFLMYIINCKVHDWSGVPLLVVGCSRPSHWWLLKCFVLFSWMLLKEKVTQVKHLCLLKLMRLYNLLALVKWIKWEECACLFEERTM